MNKVLLALLLGIIFSAPSQQLYADDPIRVGIYENKPLVFTDDAGDAQGIFIDLIEYAADREGWQIDYLSCAWSQCLEKLDAGEIDLLVSIAYTAERDERYDFTDETVLLNWGQLYSRQPAEIESILDLEGKSVAVLAGDIHYQVLQELANQFNISPDFIEVDTYTAVFDLVSRGEADAGLTNRVFGAQHEQDYQIAKTPTIFNPLDIRFAAPRDASAELLHAIDRHLASLKEDPDSAYFRSLERWFGGASRWALPQWLQWGLGVTGGLFLLFLVGNIILRRQVQARTADLEGEIAERIRAEETSRQYTRQLEALRQVGLEATTWLELDTLLRSIVERAIELVKGSSGGYSLYRPELDALEWTLALGPGLPSAGIIIQRGEGLAGQVWQERKALIADDYQQWEGRSASFEAYPITAVVGVPLLWGDEFLGVLEVLADKVGAFTPADAQALELFATQAAIAIRNARLYQETARRLAQTQVLRAVMLAAASTLDFDQVLEQVCETLQTTMEVEFLTLIMADETGKSLKVHPSSIGFSRRGDSRSLPWDQGVTGRVFQTGESIVTGDVRQIPYYQEASPEVRSELAVPIRVSGRVIGVLDVESCQLDAFDEEDLVFYTAIAGQLGIMLENVRLYQQEQRRRQEAETLRGAALALATTLERGEVVERILAQLQEAVPFDTASVQLLKGEKLEIVGGRGFPNLPELLGVSFSPQGDNPNQEVIRTRKPYILADAPAMHQDFHHKPHSPAKIRAWLGVPMLVSERLVGMIALDKNEPNFYTPEHARLAEAFAAQAAIAIENAQLFEQARRRVAQLDSLNAIIAAAAAAKNLQELLEAALDLAMKALAVEKGAFWMGKRHATRKLPAGVNPAKTRPLRALAAPTTNYGVVEDWQTVDSGSQPETATMMASLGIRASLTVPITADDEPIGGLLLASQEPRPWSQAETALIKVLGRQLGEAAAQLRLQEQSHKQAEQMEQILRSVPGGMLLLDARNRIVTANPAAWNHLMLLADASIGGTLAHLGRRPLEELLAPPPHGLWHEIVVDEPENRTFEIIARPVTVGPQAEGWVLVIHDVTHEREIQERIQQQAQLATVGQLAAGIAHDFNNILAVISLYAQLLLRNSHLPTDARDKLGTIRQQTDRAADLIQQILDFGRRAVLKQQFMDLAPLLKEQVKLLTRTLPENIQLLLVCEKNEYVVHADPARMQQMIMNLALNARDAMPAGGTIQISLDRLEIQTGEHTPLPEMQAGEWVRVTVADSGTGIPPQVRPHIFEPFFTTKAPDKGTGLGLSQVYGIVKQHGGHIDVASEMGKGSAFTLYLPALPIETPPELPPMTEGPEHGAAETVMVVEDNQLTRRAIVESLRMLDYQTLEAGNGREALAILEREGEAVQVVLTDLVMPTMGGMELIQALQKRGAPAKIIVMTGHLMDDQMDELQALGVVNWLRKPPTLEQLAQVIRQALEINL